MDRKTTDQFVHRFARVFRVASTSMVKGRTPFSFSISIGSVCSDVVAKTRLILVPGRCFSAPPELLSCLYSGGIAGLA